MSHPDPGCPVAARPWRVGDELWNPVTRERAVLLETPWTTPWVALGREFSDTVQFRSPPPAMQKVLFAAIAPLAHALGYRATQRVRVRGGPDRRADVGAHLLLVHDDRLASPSRDRRRAAPASA